MSEELLHGSVVSGRRWFSCMAGMENNSESVRWNLSQCMAVKKSLKQYSILNLSNFHVIRISSIEGQFWWGASGHVRFPCVWREA
jgi:hypothetical protein